VVDPDLKVVVEEGPGGKASVKVSGEVDIQSSQVLHEHLQEVLDTGTSSIIVDLGDVTFLDSTGLRVLIAAFQRCQRAGGELRIVSPQPNVRRVLEITGLTDLFHVQAPDEGRDI
jgi:anti-sigma B factor antagonist